MKTSGVWTVLMMGLAACGSSSGGAAVDGGVTVDQSGGGGVDSGGLPQIDAPMSMGGADACVPVSPIVVTSGSYSHQVTSSLKFGASSTEAMSYAFNLDGTTPKNVIGTGFATLSAESGVSVDAAFAASISAGQIILLHSLRADSITTDTSVSWQDYAGTSQANPMLGGGGSFTIDPSSPTSALVEGAIAGGTLTGGPGSLVIALPIAGGTPTEVTLTAARIQATCTAEGCMGTIGGGVTAADVSGKIFPALAAGIQAQITADPGCAQSCPSGCSTANQQILSLFDTNHDCMITGAELASNSIISAFFSLDLDLVDASGAACGNGTCVPCDGVKDAASIAVAFTTSTAVFTAPNE